MKALTLIEPWASLVAIGAKQIETRGWGTDYRGPLAIHAAKGMTRDDLDTALLDPAIASALRDAGVTPGVGRYVKDAFPNTRGKVIAVVTLTACVGAWPTGSLWDKAIPPPGSLERRFGQNGPGRWMWCLADVVRLPEPIPAQGELGLWEWHEVPADLADLLARRTV